MGKKKESALQQLGIARGNLLLMIILTAVNVLLFALGTDTMLLFSATVPYLVSVIGIASEVGVLAFAGVSLAAVILVLYLLCWVFSKKHYGWMIAALVLFILDSIVMILFYVLASDFSGILDVLIHIWVLYYLVVGVIYGRRLKHLPPEEELAEQAGFIDAEQTVTEGNVNALRVAVNDVKFRVLIEGNYIGHDICYRRVKRVNELVIDGYVYDEVEMLVETPHELTALIDGHTVAVGCNGSFSYIKVDEQQVAKKLRLI